MVAEHGKANFRLHLGPLLQQVLHSNTKTLRVLTACTSRTYQPLQLLLSRSLEGRVAVQAVRERCTVRVHIGERVSVVHEQLYRGSQEAVELFGAFTFAWRMAFALRAPDCDELAEVHFSPQNITTSELLSTEETHEFVGVLQDLCLLALHHDADAVLRRLKKLVDRFK
jgi:hypothetical protein